MKAASVVFKSFVALAAVSSAVEGSDRKPKIVVKSKLESDPPLYWTANINLSYVDSQHQLWHTERTETGRYSNGRQIDHPPEAEGIVVHIRAVKDGPEGQEDNSGCEGPFAANYPKDEPWIALIKRGNCTFQTKLVNAKALNASGVLVYDNVDSGELQSMRIEKRFPFPAVFTFKWKGEEIVDMIDNAVGGVVRLRLERAAKCQNNPPDSYAQHDVMYCRPSEKFHLTFPQFPVTESTDSDHSYVETSVVFVSASFLILLAISAAWVIFYYIQRFRSLHARDRLERKLCRQAKRYCNL